MTQDHITELREILSRELDEDTKAEMESMGLSLDKDENIQRVASAMTLFDAHEKGEELSEEELKLVSGGNIFKKIWHAVKKDVITNPGVYKGVGKFGIKVILGGLESAGDA
ncbi:MAG: bacteriocin [Campylobacterales bacterium]